LDSSGATGDEPVLVGIAGAIGDATGPSVSVRPARLKRAGQVYQTRGGDEVAKSLERWSMDLGYNLGKERRFLGMGKKGGKGTRGRGSIGRKHRGESGSTEAHRLTQQQPH